MQTTSHFIGIKLASSPFVDLFVELQAYCEEHGIADVVEFQNPLSVHITLYYLEAAISEDSKDAILQNIADLSSDVTFEINQLQGAYFGEHGNERVCYLRPNDTEAFTQANHFFAKQYCWTNILENQLTFVPHISLFRIKDPTQYANHRPTIDALIYKAVETMALPGIVRGIHLFGVNSLFHPEIQVPSL